MPGVTRLGDGCAGHGCFPPRPCTGASETVFVNGVAAHRKGDPWAAHGCPTCPPHGGSLAAGSGSVSVDGAQLGRVGDPVDCGSKVAEGSDNVFAGD